MQSMQNKHARYSGHGHGRARQGTAGHGRARALVQKSEAGLLSQVCQAKKVEQSRTKSKLAKAEGSESRNMMECEPWKSLICLQGTKCDKVSASCTKVYHSHAWYVPLPIPWLISVRLTPFTQFTPFACYTCLQLERTVSVFFEHPVRT
jgi:hypothetical protein